MHRAARFAVTAAAADAVSAAASVICLAKPGEPMAKGQPIVELHGDDPSRSTRPGPNWPGAVDIGDSPTRQPADPPVHWFPGRRLHHS